MKPVINNRFDNMLGPVGTSVGYFLIIAGIVLSYYSISYMILLLTGLLAGFTNSSTTIDYQSKKVRFSNNVAGVLKFGKWIDVHPDMYVQIYRNKKVFRAYSRGNKALDIKTHSYEVNLYSGKHEKVLPLKFSKSWEEAKLASEEIANRLELELRN